MSNEAKPQNAVSLPVLPATDAGRRVRSSRMGRRRAVVLAVIQLAIIVHVAAWFIYGGRTLSPVEPSDSMAFVKTGIVNAGLIFFVLALLSTLVLGRWFCGWGCHIVMLQDLCTWLMKRVGIHPKPFRSRLLVYVPLAMALYMFVWPAFFRFAVEPNWLWLADHVSFIDAPTARSPAWALESHIITDDFWAAFPGFTIAVPFIFICTFGVVYFLGSKGFCTYGCPYGGFFAPLDEISPGRIRVNDACEHCGHCTAVCTSNVRVHEEVAAYGMVVDPGCMKCLDCVSVCPNDALSFGFGAPAVRRGEPRGAEPRPRYDLTRRGELALLVFFLAVFFIFRGRVVHFPLLMTAGVTIVITWIGWKLLRLVTRENDNLHRWRLKFRGRIQPAGWVAGGLGLLVMAFTVHSAVVNGLFAMAERADDRVTVRAEVVFSGAAMQMEEPMARDAARAIRFYEMASLVPRGFAILSSAETHVDIRLAWLHSARLEFDAAEAILQRRRERDGGAEATVVGLARVLRGAGRFEEAIALYHEVLLEERDYDLLYDEYRRWADVEGLNKGLIELCEKRHALFGEHLLTMRVHSIALHKVGRHAESAAIIERTLEMDPTSVGARATIARAYTALERFDDAEAMLREALEMAPDDAGLHREMYGLLNAQGRFLEAQQYLDRANELEEQAAAAASGQTHRH